MRSSEIFTDTSSALISEPLTAPCRTSPPARETIIAAATSLASPTVAWLIPFSKRAEDSLRKLNCFAVRRIEIGSNKADSSATVVVSFVISESNPQRSLLISTCRSQMHVVVVRIKAKYSSSHLLHC